jgi:hypothetical protein
MGKLTPPRLRVVGAGLPRTGTHSLKVALTQLLGGPCYHMIEVFERPEHVSLWHDAIKGEPDWTAILTGYVAAVDWPASAFWKELSDANPDAIVLLSQRDDSDAWWRSANQTVWESLRGNFRNEAPGWHEMVLDLTRTRFADPWDDEHKAKAAYEAHNHRVRDAIDPNRLLEWRAVDGWEPICRALGLPVPAEPFPLTNTRAEWIPTGSADEPK